jgi:hypothetical protein
MKVKPITKVEALIACADLWNYTGHYLRNNKYAQGETKYLIFNKLFPTNPNCNSKCWACQYSWQADKSRDCCNCILWGDQVNPYYSGDAWCCQHGEFSKFYLNSTSKNALLIRDLALLKLSKIGIR